MQTLKINPTVLFLTVLLFGYSTLCTAQYSIRGKITSKNSSEKLVGASIKLINTYLATQSNVDGMYALKKLKAGKYTLSVSTIGYETKYCEFDLQKDTSIDFQLEQTSLLQEEFIVEATRANSITAGSNTLLSKREIETNNVGQDLPYLLNLQPSVVTTSDAGNGIGYTGIRIRGSDGSRINTTINGIALNDAESQISYFVDVPDLLSSVDNIQIQRGVGTSTNGSGAFGGSINIETSKLSVEPYATYSSSAGSFATFKNTLNLGSGLFANAYSFDVRLSKISSDGYIDRGASNLLAYYLSGGYYGKNSTFKFISFGGTEKTYQCWNGVPEAKLFGDSTALADYIQRNYLSESAAQNLLQSSARTFNSFTYTNQTDNYKQLNYQLHFSQRIKNYWNASVALHYTKGLGYYEEYKEGISFTDYNLQNVVLTNDTVYTTNLVRQKWLNNDYYGITYSLNYSRSKKFFATLGGAYSIYDGDHYTKLIWANYFSNADLNKKYNFSNGLKNDYNIYVKANYQLNSLINAFADVQFRKVTYSYPGFTTSLEIEKQKARLNFFNPKVGLSYFITSNKLLYLSYSIANKEPSRDDFTQASSTSVPAPEKLMNWELGYVQKNKRYSYSFNTYLMNYINQLVLNGEVNDVGAYNRTNVNKSHRLGIEYTTAIQLFKKLEWSANATWSSNKINQFYEFVDNYDSSYQEVIEHRNTDISFSPDWVAASTLSYTPIKNLTAVFSSKYVGKQYLDNTSSADRMLDAYWVNDLRLNYSLHLKQVKEILFTLSLNNLFNEQYESNGYTYNYISNGKLVVENFYFPQAGFNFMAGATLKF